MKRLIGCLVGLVFIAAGCGQKGPTSPSGGALTAAPPPSSAAVTVDPLTGRWRQEFTCQDVVRTLQRAGFGKTAAMAHIIRDAQGASQPPSSAHPCAGATGKYKRIARFQDGRLVLYDPPMLQVGLDASYQLVNDHTFSASDAGQNIDGTYMFNYQIKSNRLTVKLVGRGARDPFFVAAWEAAPFYRTS